MLKKKEENLRNLNEGIKQTKKFFGVLIIVLLLMVFGIVILYNRPGKITTISEATLKETFEISEFSTVEYTYNSIVTVSNEKEDMYHVAYQGIVKAGFDFNEIKVEDNKDQKIIYIYIPEIKINSVSVSEKLDYIFVKNKYDTETTYQEAYRKSLEDLEEKAKNNMSLKDMARENAITTISALIKPWEKQLPKGYKIEYK